MSLRTMFRHKIRIHRTYISGENEYGEPLTTSSVIDISNVIGERNAFVQPLSKDELKEIPGNFERDIYRVWLLSCPISIKDIIEVASETSNGSFDWTLNKRMEVMAVEEAGGLPNNHLQMIVKFVDEL